MAEGRPVDKDQALALIDAALAKLPELRRSRPRSAGHVAFMQTTGLDLARIFGPQSAVCQNFSAIRYASSGSILTSAFTYEEDLARHALEGYLNGLEHAEGVLRSARDQLVAYGTDEILQGRRAQKKAPRVFVSHGTESAALTKVERFVRTLGLNPVIVARGASKGMSVDDLVESQPRDCACAIILATADEDVGGRKQPRPNVIHEIGLAQEVLKGRLIYLKEVGCEFPSNVGPKVWENFTQANMEAAFEKIVKELRAFEII